MRFIIQRASEFDTKTAKTPAEGAFLVGDSIRGTRVYAIDIADLSALLDLGRIVVDGQDDGLPVITIYDDWLE
jgi:hypothetical protein